MAPFFYLGWHRTRRGTSSGPAFTKSEADDEAPSRARPEGEAGKPLQSKGPLSYFDSNTSFNTNNSRNNNYSYYYYDSKNKSRIFSVSPLLSSC